MNPFNIEYYEVVEILGMQILNSTIYSPQYEENFLFSVCSFILFIALFNDTIRKIIPILDFSDRFICYLYLFWLTNRKEYLNMECPK